MAVACIALHGCFKTTVGYTCFNLAVYEQELSDGAYRHSADIDSYAFYVDTTQWRIASYDDAVAHRLTNKESGEVLIAFSVGMDGYISGVRVVRSVSESLDAEAVRVVRKMPPWIPGKKNGRPVRAEMSIPINFKVKFENKYVDSDGDYNSGEKTRFKY